ncbi:hypothetical protein FWC31_03195 [Candidatus Saccharibacteria bacterium]|nr:hypothetical protein [Candidatus Saccharibacteria bacterium]
MDKEILAHAEFIKGEIAKLKKSPNRETTSALLNYHDIMTRNFQHERQIHLYITLFFACLMMGSWALVVATMLALSGPEMVLWPLWLLAAILTVLEGFYIRHYYYLENRTEKLYKLTREIYDLII